MSHSVCYQVFGRDFHIEPASIQHANSVFQDEYKIADLRPHNVRTIVDIGAHVGSFTVLCNQYWPTAKIVAVEPHPESFDLLQRNTAHIPAHQIDRIQAAISDQDGNTLLCSSVSHSRVGEYLPSIWNDLTPRFGDFGIEVPAITTERLWTHIADLGITEIDLLKLDCEGAEYLLLPELHRLDTLSHIGWIRGEWHCRSRNTMLRIALTSTHVYNIELNQPHDVGIFVAHRFSLG